jgi:hypothetical protein
MHPYYAFDSPARALDMDLATTNAYAGPNHITAGIQHGSWSMPVEAGKAPQPSMLNSNQWAVREDLPYSKEDINHVIEWTKVGFCFPSISSTIPDGLLTYLTAPRRDHLALSRHVLHGSQGGQQHRQARCTRRAPQRPRCQGPKGRRSVHLPRQRWLQHLQHCAADW